MERSIQTDILRHFNESYSIHQIQLPHNTHHLYSIYLYQIDKHYLHFLNLV